MSNTLPPSHPLSTADEILDGNVITVPVAVYADIITNIKSGKKIAAIKACRAGYLNLVGRRLSLRSAKWAVERLTEDLTGVPHSRANSPVLRSGLSILGVVVSTGTEKVEVDLEELQLRILSEVQTIGLAECGRILELVEVFQAWNRGERVGVISNNPDPS